VLPNGSWSRHKWCYRSRPKGGHQRGATGEAGVSGADAGGTRPGTLLKHHIPIKTDHWDVTEPGFAEVDRVSHSSDRADGEFVHSLDLTDIHTTWVETAAVLGKSQIRVQTALEQRRQHLPFALRGIDSDIGSEFINARRHRYCQVRDIQFTRGRPYTKDDNAHLEQKKWTHVRTHMGYLRCDSAAALAAMNEVRSLTWVVSCAPPSERRELTCPFGRFTSPAV